MAKKRLKAVILAGGLGTRLQPYTLFMPKAMLPLGEKPLVEHLIGWLRKNGVREMVVCTGYLGRTIEDYLQDGKALGVKITYARSNRPMGTAGQLKSVEGLVDGTFLCVYGDSIYEFSLNELIKFHHEKRALATLALLSYKSRLKYGFIELDGLGAVKEWKEKPSVEGLINIGCYVMEPIFLKYIPKGTMFGMDTAFEKAVKAKEAIYGYVVKGNFVDIGDRKGYMKAYRSYLKRLGEVP